MSSSHNVPPVPSRVIRALIFDLDGTLVESQTAIPDAYIATVTQAVERMLTREQVIEAYRLGPPRVILAHLLGRDATVADLQRYHSHLQQFAHQARAYPQIAQTLAVLAPRMPLAVFSGGSHEACEILLTSAGLASYFSVVVSADDVAHSKPSPDGVLLACSRLGVPATHAAFVGDSPLDMEAARRAGSLAIAAAWGHQYASDFYADLILTTPTDLLNPLILA